MWQQSEWRDKIESESASMRDYLLWHANPTVNQDDLNSYHACYGRDGWDAGHLAIQCYPAELMTKKELERRVGVVW